MPFTFVGTGSASDKPLGAVLHFNGKVYCGCSSGNAKGFIFNPADNTFTTFTLPNTDYYPRVLLLDGKILFAPLNNTSKSWLLVNEDGTYTALNDWDFSVNGASLMRDGKVAICNTTTNKFGVFNPKTTFLENFPNVPSVITSGVIPNSVTLLPDGKLLLITNNATYPAWIYNPFNSLWEQISLNGLTASDNNNKGALLYDGGLAVFGSYYGLSLINIYSKKIIDVESMVGSNVLFIRICPDGDVFLVNNNTINKFHIENNIITNVGYTNLPSSQISPSGCVMLPSGKLFYCCYGDSVDNNGFVIWDSSLGTLPDEVCLSAFYNRG